jgi:hypothetical protein
VKTRGPRSGLNRLAPFPFSPMFQNGPRPQGFAPENLFKTHKRLSSAAHTPRALDRSGPFRKPPNEKGKGANAKAKPRSASGPILPPDGRPRAFQTSRTYVHESQNPSSTS